jgi:hypothetical protein
MASLLHLGVGVDVHSIELISVTLRIGIDQIDPLDTDRRRH